MHARHCLLLRVGIACYSASQARVSCLFRSGGIISLRASRISFDPASSRVRVVVSPCTSLLDVLFLSVLCLSPSSLLNAVRT